MLQQIGYTINPLVGGGAPPIPSSTVVRAMALADVQPVLALWDQSCLEATGHPLSPEERERVLHVLEQYPLHADTSAFVAGAGSDLDGFATGFLTRHPVMEGILGQLDMLYVNRDCRRKGIGSALVRHVAADLKRRGAWAMRAGVPVEDETALKFWKAQGWSMELVNFGQAA